MSIEDSVPRIRRRHAEVVSAILGLRPAIVAYMPSASIAPVISGVEESAAELPGDERPRVFAVSREEEAMGIVGALPLAGKFGVILMQDNGFGNSLTAMTTFTLSYHLPLLVISNTRGGLGEYNSMIHSFSENVPEILRAAGIKTFTLDRRHSPEDWGATVAEAGVHAQMTYRPVAVLLEFFDVAGEGSAA